MNNTNLSIRLRKVKQALGRHDYEYKDNRGKGIDSHGSDADTAVVNQRKTPEKTRAKVAPAPEKRKLNEMEVVDYGDEEEAFPEDNGD